MTFIFDLFISKSNQFLFVYNCTLVVNLEKFLPTSSLRYHVYKLTGWAVVHSEP